MRFRFCGDLDCPDWVLAEMNILARLTSVKMKLLVMQVIRGILDEGIDFVKVEKLTSDAKYDIGDIKASVAGLQFIITSAAKHGVNGETLSNELQQLGLPKEHSTTLCKSYESKLSEIHANLLKKSFRQSACLKSVDWKINPKAMNEVERTIDISIELLTEMGNIQLIEFKTTTSKFRIFLHELKVAQGHMNSVDV